MVQPNSPRAGSADHNLATLRDPTGGAAEAGVEDHPAEPLTTGHRHRREPRYTPTDAEWLRWLGRVRYANAPQLARRFLPGRKQPLRLVYWRTARLEDWGLLERANKLWRQHGLFVVTPAGYRASRSPLEPPRDREVKLGPIEHTLGVVDLVIAYERTGATVITEREFSTLERDQHGQSPYMVRVSSFAAEGRAMWHPPDFVVVRPNGGVVAVELELSLKSASRVKDILSAYQRSPIITHVRYFVPADSKGRRIAETLDQVARRLGMHRDGQLQTHAYRPDGEVRIGD